MLKSENHLPFAHQKISAVGNSKVSLKKKIEQTKGKKVMAKRLLMTSLQRAKRNIRETQRSIGGGGTLSRMSVANGQVWNGG